MTFTDAQISALRDRVSDSMSSYRFVHTAEVEKMAERIAKIYAPDKADILRVAALLHDITKEKSTDEQCEILLRNQAELTANDLLAPKTLHARTAFFAVKEYYSEYADEEVLSAVLRHTTGSADMSLCDMIIYLADYIDESRKFSDCVRLREYFFSVDFGNMTDSEKMTHLYKTLLMSFDMTLISLIEEGIPISPDSVAARNAIVCLLHE